MPIIGLTGNFGMGKSTVLRLFSKLGNKTYDVDEFVHEILRKPDIILKISRLLGADTLTKKSNGIYINKKRVASIIFNNPEKRAALEKIIHPEVLKKIKRITSLSKRRGPAENVFIEVPLLFEAGYEKYFDRTIVVYCKRETAIKRLLKSGTAKDDALRRIRAQMPVTTKKKLADFIIDNSMDIEQTEQNVRKILKMLRAD